MKEIIKCLNNITKEKEKKSSLGEREEKKHKAKVIKFYHLENLVRIVKSLWELFIIFCELKYVKIKT